MNYTRQQLIKLIVRDLIIDIRYNLAHQDIGNSHRGAIACLCKEQLHDLFKARHTVQLDKYGWPRLHSFNSQVPK